MREPSSQVIWSWLNVEVFVVVNLPLKEISSKGYKAAYVVLIESEGYIVQYEVERYYEMAWQC